MDRVLIVTGGSRGIGAAICRLAGARGYAVAVNYARDKAAADSVVADIEKSGRRAVAIQADVSDEAAVERLFEETARLLGPVTHLVNNAGMTGPSGKFAGVTGDIMREVVALNVLGLMYCTKAAVRRFSTRLGGKGGVIVNVSSAAATTGSPDIWVWYAATKGAVDTLTVGLGREVAAEGVRVAAIAPGFTATDLVAAGLGARMAEIEASIPAGRAGRPQEMAEGVLYLLSDAASYVTATTLRISGGR